MASRDSIKKGNIPSSPTSESLIVHEDAGENHSSGYVYILAPAFDLKISMQKDWLANAGSISVYATPYSFKSKTWGDEISIGTISMSRTDSGTHHRHFVYNWNPSPTSDTVWKTVDEMGIRLWEVRWTSGTPGNKWLRLRTNSIAVSNHDPKGELIYGLSFIGEKHYGDFKKDRTSALSDLNITSRHGSQITVALANYCVSI